MNLLCQQPHDPRNRSKDPEAVSYGDVQVMRMPPKRMQKALAIDTPTGVNFHKLFSPFGLSHMNNKKTSEVPKIYEKQSKKCTLSSSLICAQHHLVASIFLFHHHAILNT